MRVSFVLKTSSYNMQPNYRHIAIDPGVSGGIAYFNFSTGKLEAVPMPSTQLDAIEILKKLKALNYDRLVIEKIPKFAGKAIPSSTTAVLFENLGILIGAAMVLQYRIERPTPQEWQKELGLGTSKGMTKTEWKNKLKARAQELYPGTPLTLKTADAALLYEFGKRTH